jgi:outer membrane protein OmpA-like peptidoglycan-associated protein/tetratricopeptide (TPR) repeat protein
MKTNIFTFKNIALFIFVVVISNRSFGQSNLQKAQKMVANYEYQKAIDLYTEYFKANTPAIDDARSLAQCYMMVNDSKSATDWMGKVVAMPGKKPSDVLNYANLLKSEGKYAEAINQYNDFKTLVPDESDKADQWIEACKQSEKWIAKPIYFDIDNAKVFNSANSDFGLIPFDKGYIITSDRRLEGVKYGKDAIYSSTGDPYYKLYYLTTDKGGSTLNEMKVIPELNNDYHNGPGVFDKTTSTFYFTRTKMVKVPKKPLNPDPTNWFDLSQSSDYVNRLTIYTAKFTNGKWSDVEPFAYNKPEEYSIGHPAISPDGNILYFASDMPSGSGATDIYYCLKNSDGTWAKPVNAGNTINTNGKELFPWMASDGALYFSSDGLAGLGGLDIFSSKGSKNSWSAPENLKFPLNSSRDDFSICFTNPGKEGYLASNRASGIGSDDIYHFVENPPKDLMVAVIAKEKLDNNKLVPLSGVDIEIINKTSTKSQSFTTDANGSLYNLADCGTFYEIKGKKEGYLSQMKAIETKCITKNDTMFVELTFDKLIIEKPIALFNIYYDYDKWDVKPDQAVELDALVTVLKENPQILVELGSHTDSRGSDAYNNQLSQKRADAAVKYIISKGIDKKRITAKGYGETQPVNKCTDDVACNEDEYTLNRRTEYKVIGIDKTIKVKSQAKTPKNIIGKTGGTSTASMKEDKPRYHEVKTGETLFSIAMLYKVKIEKLKVLNNLSDNTIIVGQKLKLY